MMINEYTDNNYSRCFSMIYDQVKIITFFLHLRMRNEVPVLMKALFYYLLPLR